MSNFWAKQRYAKARVSPKAERGELRQFVGYFPLNMISESMLKDDQEMLIIFKPKSWPGNPV